DGKVMHDRDDVWLLESEGTHVYFAEEKDGNLWRLTQALGGNEVGEVRMERLSPKLARVRTDDRAGPSKIIDFARENSLRIKYQLYTFLMRLARGDRVRSIMDGLDSGLRETARLRTPEVWEVFSGDDVPKLW
ncbi:MAG: hypothetical protein ACXAAQ_16305, partial [Candidatus Thorarchaeota archaeon]